MMVLCRSIIEEGAACLSIGARTDTAALEVRAVAGFATTSAT